ncbi:Sugar kinase of the NBD/HSP70 family, may contain an N-terminal HTH domain [Thermophagus xiamenensis]|uniref:Sugar kinase of the NBD/HSP70 family, may contain an N-terminal HTH domain n=2 Tax=Thermophagus xiamenensis TaxID=385682 RepID=A0A1I1ZWA6_9BACT|nr:Sugar kinase of the NBD/HSP70 family, may contain an N-terminal HTH domain [Thermophagus xiamenensis]
MVLIDIMENYLINTYLFEALSDLEKKKYQLSIRILKYLYFQGPKAIADICNYLKVSTPNGNSILGILMSKGLIEKKGYGLSKGGRKPELYGLKKDVFYVVSVDMNIHQTQLSIFDSSNSRVTEIEAFALEMDNEIHTLDKLLERIHNHIKKSGIDKQKIVGVGVSFPGLVDSSGGFNYSYFNFGDKPVRSILQEQLCLPVFVENDAKAVALAVWRFGIAQNQKDVLVLFLDWGIGLGMILNGKLYRGNEGFAGEFSHIPMVENGDSCICGKNGCLQTLAAGSTLVQRAREGILKGKSSLMAQYSKENIKDVDLQTVVSAALKGDQFSINLLSEIGEQLGKGISILIQLFNPGMVVLTGKMAEAGQYLTIPIQQAINTYSMHRISESMKIKHSNMGKQVGLNGALAVVMEDIFDVLGKTLSSKKLVRKLVN